MCKGKQEILQWSLTSPIMATAKTGTQDEEKSVQHVESEQSLAVLPKHARSYIRDCTRDINKSSSPALVMPPSPELLQKPMLENYTLPVLLLWDPINQLANIIKTSMCPLHLDSQLTARDWHDGVDDVRRKHPRRLLHAEGSLWLVAREYACNKYGHRMLSSHAAILQLLPSQYEVPFVLTSSHAGFSRQFLLQFRALMATGMPFTRAAAFFRDIVISRRQSDLVQLWEHGAYYKDNVDKTFCATYFPESLDHHYIDIHSPSDDALARLFLRDFAENRELYDAHMCSIEGGEALSIDHTFKVAANIGIINPLTKKFDTQYNSLFLVLNAQGQVVTWKLTRGESLDEVSHLLTQLRRRYDNLGSNPPQFIVADNCCMVRKKLQTVFGSTTRVVLDLFHANQRVNMHIPKRGKFAAKAAKDLSVCFRQSTDVGKKRTAPTPDKATIVQNLRQFKEKYTRIITVAGQPILSSEAVKEVDKLIQHAEKGCLSEIPPGVTTSRNENLHKHLRRSSKLSVPRMSPYMAIANLYLFLGDWNSQLVLSRTAAPKKKKTVPLCGVVKARMDAVKKKLGVAVPAVIHSPETFGLGTEDFRACAMEFLAGWGTMTEEDVRLFIGQQLPEDLQQDCQPRQACSKGHVLQNALRYYDFLSAMSSPRLTTSKLGFCSHPALYVLLGYKDRGTMSIDSQLFQQNLAQWDLEIGPVPEQGHTLCNALWCWHSKISPSKDVPKEYKAFSACVADGLRQELTHNRSFYQPMVHYEESDLPADIWQCRVRQLLPLAAANVLKRHLVIVTSFEYLPVIPCLSTQITDEPPLFLGFTHSHGGQFIGLQRACPDPASQVPGSASSMPHTATAVSATAAASTPTHSKHAAFSTTNPVKCSCGRGRTGEKRKLTYCHMMPGQLSRCPCALSGVPCASTCRCLNCKNPSGSKILDKKPRNTSLQDLTLAHARGQDKMVEAGERPAAQHWSLLENCVLEATIASLPAEQQGDKRKIWEEYNHILETPCIQQRTCLLPQRSLKQVEAKVQHRQDDHLYFLQLLQHHISEEIGMTVTASSQA